MANSLDITVFDREFHALAERFPRIVNSGINRANQQAGARFARSYAPHLRSVVRPRRMAKVGKNPRGAPALPVAMRRLGFKARVFGRSRLHGKGMRISVRNPAVVAREKGATLDVTPKMRRAIFARLKASKRFRKKRVGPSPGVTQIRIPANLRLVSSWTAFHPKVIRIYSDALRDMVRRANLKLDRDAARAAEREGA